MTSSSLILDFPFAISKDTILDMIFATNGYNAVFWVPRPPPGYRNLGHYITVGSGVPVPTIRDTTHLFLFVIDDPLVSKVVTSYTPLTNNANSILIEDTCCTVFSPNCIVNLPPPTGNGLTCGCCADTIFKPIPEAGFVVMGHCFAPGINAPPSETNVKDTRIWSIRPEWTYQNNVNDFAPIVFGTTGSSHHTIPFQFVRGGYNNLFYAFPVPISATDARAFQIIYGKRSKADKIACCTQETKFRLDPVGDLSNAGCCAAGTNCGAGNTAGNSNANFYGPQNVTTGDCDIIYTDLCSDEKKTDPIRLKNPKCGCVLPPEFYVASNLLGPIECVASTCTSNPDAYKKKGQVNTQCNITNCIINSNSVAANNVNNVVYQQQCGTVTGKAPPAGTVGAGSSSQSFSSFLRSRTALIIIGIAIAVIILIIIIYFIVRARNRRRAVIVEQQKARAAEKKAAQGFGGQGGIVINVGGAPTPVVQQVPAPATQTFVTTESALVV